MPLEIELKLRLSPEDAAKLQHHPFLRSLTVSRPVTRKLFTTYYDTPDLYLQKHHMALRLRHIGRKWIQSIKGGGEAALGLHQRHEWESMVPTGRPDFSQITDPSLIRLFDGAELHDQLRVLFTTDFKRSKRILHLVDGSEIEFSLDQGVIRTPADFTREICEIELELKSGRAQSLYRFALDILHIVPLRLENASKAERGYGLVTGFKPAPVKAVPVRLETEMKLGEAIKAIAWNCLQHLHGNEAGMLQHQDPEYLHQMRVALRRIRTARRVFARAFDATAFASATPDLKWLSRSLGAARDWDVFVSETLSEVRNYFHGRPGISALWEECEQMRQNHNDGACEAVGSTRYTEAMLRLGAWLNAETWLPAPDPQQSELRKARLEWPVKKFADNALSHGQEKLKKYYKKADGQGTEELHALRIAVKEQRYTAEFFSDLYRRKKVKRYIKSLTVLQETLGAVIDTSVTERLLNEVGVEGRGENGSTCEARGIVLGWIGQRGLTKRSELDEVWGEFEKKEVFW
ncbi:Inorganic triphosphatase YgiF, contains CYTH and CHAD domains [Nitrosospira multiformis]|uniref:Inorganic triphosphatase YgiF, contains CYTH and CHAD domains n=1 Tax=Nitrosospira multiformis TaxID=1231 RepID=A0A1H8DHU5_9PROT|nr:CYTH and CHAD domain-containing protein [Nitrosospira multiformis]SEN06334.1 Inorganic triphosphatase YgiF, contains CYTH and CHAD domains [Nitrosospira multiformis]